MIQRCAVVAEKLKDSPCKFWPVTGHDVCHGAAQFMLSSATLIASLWVAAPLSAFAADECGVAVGATIVCADSALNPYATGITYATASGLAMSVGAGVVVNRTPGANNDGIRIDGNGSDLLSVVLAGGATITTDGTLADGVQVRASGNSSIEINSGANISVNIAGALNPGIGTNGLLGWVDNGAGSGHIAIRQDAGSAITITGFEGSGIYGLHTGLGAVYLETSGAISTAGERGYGVNAWNFNTLSTGNVVTSQSATGAIVTDGIESAGLYSLTYGLGATEVNIAGSMETLQDGSDGGISFVDNGLSLAGASVNIAETGMITTRGDRANGAWGYNAGLGTVNIESSGSVATFGDNSAGLRLLSSDAANTATDSIDLLGNAVIQTTGTGSHGVRAVHVGAGIIELDIRDNSTLTTSGDRSNGVDASSGGAIALGLGASASISVTGAESFGVRADAVAGTAAIAVDGRIQAGGEFGVGVSAQSMLAEARVDVAAGATVAGGWQTNIVDVGATTSRPSAGVILGSATGSILDNAGVIGAASDRAVVDAGRYGAPLGNVSIHNSGTIAGFVELAPVASNSFTNVAGGLFDVRHFADTNGDGTRDTKRVSISDFGAPSSSFNNLAAATVRLAPVLGEAAIDATDYFVPTTGIDSRPLEASYYALSRSGVVQGQFTNLGTFHNAGVLDLRGSATGNTLVMTGNAVAGGAPGNGVFISDGGHLLLNSVLNEGVAAGGQTGSFSDVLVVDSTRMGSGATTITIDRREGAGAGTPGNGILLVEVRNKAASAPGVFALNGDFVVNGEQAVIQGAHYYNLYHNGVAGDVADGNWYLRNLGYSPNVPVYEEYPKVLVPLVEVPTLQQRAGNRYWFDPAPAREPKTVFCKDPARNFRCAVTDEQAAYYLDNESAVTMGGGGLWGRVEAARSHFASPLSASQAVSDLNIWRLQAGVDGVLAQGDSGTLIAGVTAQYGLVGAEMTASGAAGSINASGYGLGGTLTWYGESGFYVDAQAQANWFSSTLSSATLGRTLVDDNKGFGAALSLEAGQRIALDAHWGLTPQAQLTFSNVSFDSFTDPFGTSVSLLSGQSLQGRLGLASEYQTSWREQTGELSRVSAYGVANIYHEFLDGIQVDVAGTSVTSRDDRLWGGLGLGGSYEWADGKYALHGEISAKTGLENFGKSYEAAATLGLRVKW
ncbi:autotransporter outer membrane beta-barrel domain-containing protein [Devosia sp. A369]